MKHLSTTFFVVISLMSSCAIRAQESIDLSGKWHCERGEVTLPGSLLTNNLGEEISLTTPWTGSLYDSSYYYNPFMKPYRLAGKIKFPFFLTPNSHYVGHITYTKGVYIPTSWNNKRIILFLERPHIETTIRVNQRYVGHQVSLSTPHEYDVTAMVIPGKVNDIEIEVYNGVENVGVGQDSHSVSDQTQGNWNGIVGVMELRSFSCDNSVILPYKVRVFPHYPSGDVTVVVNQDTSSLQIDNPELWDEFHPVVYHRSVVYHGITVPLSFGFREIGVQGRNIVLNGKPIYIRGTVENCVFPLTGYPPTDVSSWVDIISTCKHYGLNMMRFHSYCPPEAAFIAADSLGFYLQPEGPSWPNHGVRLGQGQVIDTYLLEETKRIVDTYGNHPSFVMMAAGNEPAGDWVAWCDHWVQEMLHYDSRRIYCGASVGGGWAWDGGSQYHVRGGARGLDWDNKQPSSDDDYLSQIEYPRNYKGLVPNQSPILAHEQGQWCSFPDLEERKLYTGVYKAYNYDIFSDILVHRGMAAMAANFLSASSHLQMLAYKYEIERNLRTPDYSGFQLLGLNDYPGQGTAIVGVLNTFWKEKSYTDQATNQSTWNSFCNTVVPLARFPSFVFTSKDTLKIPIEVYNATGDELHSTVRYTINDDYSHSFETVIAPGKGNILPTITLSLNELYGIPRRTDADPLKKTLTVNVDTFANSWDFWIYSNETAMPPTNDILVTDTLDEKTVDVLQNGGKVLITAVKGVRHGKDVKQTYLPVFWNTSWFKMRPPHTTGVAIDNNHPLFRHGFPTDTWAEINWWELVNKVPVMDLSRFPKEFQPVIQPIDTWHVGRKLGLLAEAKVLNGKLIITTADITNDIECRIVARQLRKTIIEYMQSKDFEPKFEVDINAFVELFTMDADPVNMFTNESPDELKPTLP